MVAGGWATSSEHILNPQTPRVKREPRYAFGKERPRKGKEGNGSDRKGKDGKEEKGRERKRKKGKGRERKGEVDLEISRHRMTVPK